MFWYLFGAIILLIYSLLLFLLRKDWKRLSYSKVPIDFIPSFSFSVVIPARNEEEVIEQCLDSVLAQRYPSSLFEIILVDDFSEDKTAIIAKKKDVRIIHLKEIVNNKINSYKKKAVEEGIKAAKGDYIVVTDADCIVPTDWLRTLAWMIENQKPVMIAAPVRMQGSYFSFLGLFQSLDFLSLQGITAAATGSGKMSLCNGANLCYSKEAFIKVGGFEGVDQIASGDDLLLMHKFSNKYPGCVKYCFSEDVIVQTTPEKTFKSFISQRIRWASKATVYKDKRITATLSLVYLVNLFPFLLVFAAFLSPDLGILLLVFLIIKTITELYFLIPVAEFFKQSKQLRYFVFMQPFHIVYTVITGLLGQGRSYDWKGRKVK
jgi:cellulose synthase/poly-beta-1,6-N-acetylglucosamine synthase-like glycosyltransferase